MPESRPYHHGDLRAALLAAAERTLREKGTAALSLRELAREVGVSHAAPGRHFKDKQALLNALALAGYERLAQSLNTADDPALPLEPRLTALVRAYLAFAIDNAALLELMYARKHEPDASEQMAAAVEQTVGSLERVLAEAQQRGEVIDGDPAELNLVTGATLHGVAGFISAGWLTPEAALAGAEGLVHFLLHGLKPR
ncbi:TetR family transcriptional regulator [Streptomyces viridochromogenes]|uniref:TetR family transcriptional regulator n=1 Tax=Streptomyces viridochromogenes TaxID=1938 RepID=A0A0J7YZZ2_STRVR|nr:TetR/AcrR family transcriptional regulator [Streptomyces viridochromogenes]KMS69281.1 TetR family transcriptional regulator [Streptomyces viridochromogenes]KOG09939.1 TetR family transcriptional regulator [Streptomyces viridochromogenes]KOG21385.1 TetR family transcriptional regulator [Streptomyces viridochromogenes]